MRQLEQKLVKTSGDLFCHNNGLKKPCKFAAGCRGRAIVLVEITALSWAVLFKRCLSAYVEEAQSVFFFFWWDVVVVHAQFAHLFRQAQELVLAS